MSDLMLHGVLNMPLPDDPREMSALQWGQFRSRARQASAHIDAQDAKIKALVEVLGDLAERAGAVFQSEYHNTSHIEGAKAYYERNRSSLIEARAALAAAKETI